MKKSQITKKKVRDTKEWKQLRVDMAAEHNNLCALTKKRLLKGWNLHHLCMKESEYSNFSHDRFIPLNVSAHDCIHYLYRYYLKDKGILTRLKKILDDMVEFNN